MKSKTKNKPIRGRLIPARVGIPLVAIEIEVWSGRSRLGVTTADEEGKFAIEIRQRDSDTLGIYFKVFFEGQLVHQTYPLVRHKSKPHVIRIPHSSGVKLPLESTCLIGLAITDAGVPLMGFAVEALNSKDMVIAKAVSQKNGLFILHLKSGSITSSVAVRVLDKISNKELVRGAPKIDENAVASVRLEVPTSLLPRPGIPITQLAHQSVEIPASLARFLANTGIHTLDDVRSAGDLASLKGIPVQDSAAIHALQAHADLAALTNNVSLSSKLMEKGFDSVRKIADAPSSLFVTKIGPTTEGSSTLQLQTVARTRAAVLDHARAAAALGLPVTVWTNPPDTAGPQFATASCDCDCQGVVSPVAYLVDLLDFVVKRIVNGGNPLSLQDLVNKLLQPFDNLIVACDALEMFVRQARIAIEVLRAAKPQLNVDDSAYRQSVYQALLGQMGVSYEDLRFARAAPAEQRRALAIRLGISLSSNRPDELDKLTFDLAQKNQPLESDLEVLFGLSDTHKVAMTPSTADPLLLSWQKDFLRSQWSGNPIKDVPIIDPDLIDTRDLVNSVPGDAAFDILDARMKVLAAKDAANRTLANGQTAQVDPLIQAVIGVPIAQLDGLDVSRRKGQDIETSLSQLYLGLPAFDRLLELRIFISNGGALSEGEWNDLYDILLESWKRQQFSSWITEESTKKIILGPDLFQIPVTSETLNPTPPFVFLPWRATVIQRRTWQAVLRARIDQNASLTEALAQSVDVAEERTITTLRDLLINAADSSIRALEDKAHDFEQEFLIDMRTAGCHKTTRTAQAITSLQGLVFAVRNGEFLGQSAFALDPVAEPSFDEEWRWMGEYSAWRSALLVFLYPDNLLDPTLRPAGRQTPVFREIVDKMRTESRVTPVEACEAAGQYSQYLREICSLEVQASCTAPTPQYFDDCHHRPPGPDTKTLLYLFGRSPKGIAYLSTLDLADPSGYSQSYWTQIPGLPPVESIVGVQPYFPSGSDLQQIVFVYVTKEQGVDKLFFTTYDLLTQNWTQNLVPLTLPGVGSFSATVSEREDRLDTPPRIAILMKGGTGATDSSGNSVDGVNVLFSRELSADLVDWGLNTSNFQTGSAGSQGAFFVVLNPASVTNGEAAIKLLGALSYGDDEFHYMFYADPNGGLRACVLEWTDPWTFEVFPLDAPSAQWSGCVIFNAPYILLMDSSGPTTALKRLKQPTGYDDMAVPSNVQRFAMHSGAPLAEFVETSYTYKWPATFVDGLFNTWSAGLFQIDDNLDVVLLSDNVIVPPSENVPFDLTERADLQARAKALALLFPILHQMSDTLSVYFKEAYYFLPIFLAGCLTRSAEYTTALDWYRSVYDYSQPPSTRVIYYGFVQEASIGDVWARLPNWLLDPLNPHAVAETRQHCYLRATLLLIVRCVLAYADSEFTRDTTESVERARLLYLLAIDLLDVLAGLSSGSNPDCPDVLGNIPLGFPDEAVAAANSINQIGTGITDPSVRQKLASQAKETVAMDGDWRVQLARIRETVKEALTTKPPAASISDLLKDRASRRDQLDRFLLSQPMIVRSLDNAADQTRAMLKRNGRADRPAPSEKETLNGALLGLLGQNGGGTVDPQPAPAAPDFMPSVSEMFCVPPNPLPGNLRQQAEVNLFKIRRCRNIAGLERELPLYDSPTSVEGELPAIGSTGKLQLPSSQNFAPTPYRYQVLLDRSKQLVAQAAQLEAAFLSALEKRDNEQYNLLHARQDLRVTRATVQLQDLRVSAASAGVALAEAQLARQQDAVQHYSDLVKEGTSSLEQAALGIEATGVAHLHLGAAIKEATTFGLGGIGDVGSALIATASLMKTQASYDRRQQEWEFQSSQALDDVRIGKVQNVIAEDGLRISGQERAIAQLQSDNATQSANFLATKFTNAELFDWMSNVLGNVYRYFLQQAASTAMAATGQLAFERQQVVPPFIQGDYWEPPSDSGGTTAQPQDRQGLTGSERLLGDIAQLDQYAFDTNKRKLQLSKTLSLARLAPAEFQRFRETGLIRFTTPMDLFDHEFPGHYVRLIRRVKTSVIALVPPEVGIRATLSTSGVSRAVVAPDFRTVVVRREPQSVGLTSPRDASGVFDLDVQPELSLPFEGLGVDTDWEFLMPKPANPFSFTSIADVLTTFEYTALDSPDYRDLLLNSPDFNGVVRYDFAFSFVNDLQDPWYDLHNPDQTATPMKVRWSTDKSDFPPNIDELTIEQVAVYFARAEGEKFEVSISDLSFTPIGGTAVHGAAQTTDGIASTRRGNAPLWTGMIGKSPFGEWSLTLPDTAEDGGATRSLFAKGQVIDILLSITYSAQPSAWPS